MRGIYIIINNVNQKYYIGKSENIDVRWYNHIYELNHDTHPNTHLQNAWNLYGEGNFTFDILYECKVGDDINAMEIKYIKEYDACNPNVGYNIALGGQGGSMNEATKKKISVSHRFINSNLTYEDVRRIKTLLYCGIDRDEILKEFDIGRKVLQNIIIEKAFQYVLPECNEFIHHQRANYYADRNRRILEMYDGGMSIQEVVNNTIYSASIVEKCIYANRPVERNYNIRKLSKEQEEQAFDLWNKGMTTNQIAKEFNCSDTTIKCIVNRYEKKIG